MMSKFIFSTYDKRTTTGLNTYSKEFNNISQAKKFADTKQNIFGITIIEKWNSKKLFQVECKLVNN